MGNISENFVECKELYEEFKQKFTLGKLQTVSLDEFVPGKNDSFCSIIACQLEGLGSLGNQFPRNFGVCFVMERQEYDFTKKYGDTLEEAFNKVKNIVYKIAQYASSGNFNKIDQINYAEAIKWKIAFLYTQGELEEKPILPIYSKDKLMKIAKRKGIAGIDKQTPVSQIYECLIQQKPIDCKLSDYYEELWSLTEDNKGETNNTSNMTKDNALSENEKAIQDMLLANHNIILHGAPGTGKTYLAQKIAEALGANKENCRFKMVQFHPSYDYTDFVEGLRPAGTDKNGNIIFARQDGVFKEFCKKAVNAPLIESAPTNNKSNIVTEKELKNAWDIFVKIIDDNKSKGYKLELDDGKSTPNLTIGEFVKNSAQYENKTGDKRIEWGIGEHYCSWGYILNIHREFKCPQMISKNGDIEKAAPGTTHQYLNYIYKKVYEIAGKQVCCANNNPYFIFLIDEINRGDMSKIFGELFYAIDPGYRGEKGKIDTQYQNLVTAKYKDENGDEYDDPFHKGFYVPDNVYIIGTMNDIDRSVESMDFAMRRRFQFIEVTAESRAEGMKLKYKKEGKDDYTETNAYKRMTNLNNCIISKEIGLSKAYQIGGSYFLSNQKDDKGNRIPIEGNFEDLWKYKLEGLLREYLRGEEENVIKDKLEKLHRAFGLDDEYKYNETTGEIEKMPKPDTGNNKTTTDE